MIDQYHIKLLPNQKLLSPGFKVYHRHHGNKDHMRRDDVSDDGRTSECHYHGVVESHGEAKAAVSLCGGVVGNFSYFTQYRKKGIQVV